MCAIYTQIQSTKKFQTERNMHVVAANFARFVIISTIKLVNQYGGNFAQKYPLDLLQRP